MKNKIIFYAFMASLLSASLTSVDASKRMRETDSTDTEQKRQRTMVVAAPATLPATSPFETLPRDQKVSIALFLNNEETLGAALVRFSLVSKSCYAAALATMPFLDLNRIISPSNLTPASIDLLKNYRSTHVIDTNPSDASMEKAAQLGNIKQLELDGRGKYPIQVTKKGFTCLPQLSAKLTELRLFDVMGENTNDYKSALGALTNLVSLDFSTGQMCDDVIPVIAALPSLEHLFLDSTTNFSDSNMPSLKSATKLRRLNLHDTFVSDDMILDLEDFKLLEIIDVSSTRVTANGVDFIKALLPNIKEVRR